MPLPDPFPGLMLHYSYLWSSQRQQGLEEGIKHRPCVIVLAALQDSGDKVVTVVPVTHALPADATKAVEIPPATKRRLGLDETPSWVVVSEANRFHWPGFDLRPVPGQVAGKYDYGVLPPRLFRRVRDAFLNQARFQKLRFVPR